MSGRIYFCDLYSLRREANGGVAHRFLATAWHILVVVASIRLWCIATRLSSTHGYMVLSLLPENAASSVARFSLDSAHIVGILRVSEQ